MFGSFDLWSASVALFSGTAFGFLFGILPGIGGRTGVLVLLPVAVLFDPWGAAIFLFAMHAVVHTASAIPPIAFGLPTGSSDLATYVDGYPLARMGRAGEALGASLSASAIGGVIGALAFLFSVPVARPLVTSFGPPEFFMLAIFGVAMVATLSREGLLPGLVVAIVGALLAMVGFDNLSASPRFTFGSLELWDGLNLVALICGVYVVPEMMALTGPGEEARQRAISTTAGDVFRGMLVTFRHKAVVLRSSLWGIVIGMTPAVGASVAVWLAYGDTARRTKSDIPFGQGAIAGVIAPEAANNAKEGGAMIPTLFFGIPGSSTMAIMIAALSYAGVLVGPNMLTSDIGLSYALAGTIFLANVLAIPAFFAVIPLIVRFSAVRPDAVAPIAIALSVMSALISQPSLVTDWQLLLASALGIGLKLANWPRAPFVLGFIMSKLAETAFHQTLTVWGWSGFLRPISLLLLVVVVVWVAYSFLRRAGARLATKREATLWVAATLLLFFVAAGVASLRLPDGASPLPGALSAAGALLSLSVLLLAWRMNKPGAAERMDGILLWIAYVALVPLLGLVPASAAFVAAWFFRRGIGVATTALVTLVFGLTQAGVLATVFDVLVEREILGRALWLWLGY